MKKANYECPELEIVILHVNDAIMTSGLDAWDNVTDRDEEIGV